MTTSRRTAPYDEKIPPDLWVEFPRTDVLRREAGYFQDNYRCMQYLEIREEGFPIGSGVVESACKRFRAQLAESRHALVARWLGTLAAHLRCDHESSLR